MRASISNLPVIVWCEVMLFVAAVPEIAACQLTQPRQTTSVNKVLPKDIEIVLDRLERAGEELMDLTADVTYSVVQLIKQNPDDPDEVQNYVGMVKYLKTPETTLWMIHFEKWYEEKANFESKWNKSQDWYIFDGRWFIRARELAKEITRRELVRPGEQVDLFKLGEGPFPLPFGQKKADILQQFEITLTGPSAADPLRTDHLVCLPKPQTQLSESHEKIEFFISNDQKSTFYGLPVKIVLHNRQEAVRKTATFRKIKKNSGLKAKGFKLPPQTRNWHEEIVPLPPPEQ